MKLHLRRRYSLQYCLNKQTTAKVKTQLGMTLGETLNESERVVKGENVDEDKTKS